MRYLSILLLLCACNPMADRKVEMYNIQLASDITTRGQMEREAIVKRFESFRDSKHAEINKNREAALLYLEQIGKLDHIGAIKAADKFQAVHQQLDSRVNLAKELALKQCDWYDTAAATVLATVEYMQTKDTAIVEGAKAALESFTQTYAATRSEPTDVAGKKAQELMDTLQVQLTDLLSGSLSGAQ